MDEDIFALLTGDGPTAQERALALAQKLRGQRALGQLGILSGDPVLAQVGQAQLAEAGQGREAIVEAGRQRVGLQKAMEAMRAEAAKNEREKAEEAARWERDTAYRDKARKETIEGQIRAAGISAGRRTEAELAKEGREATAGISPEFELVPGARPTEQQKNKFSTGVSSANKLKELVGQLRAELAGAGSVEQLVGAKADLIDQLLTQMRIEGKGVAELGALSGPDLALMNKLMQNPAGLRAQFLGTGEKLLSGVERWADTQVSGAMKAYGLRRKQKLIKGKSGKTYKVVAPGDFEEVDDGP